MPRLELKFQACPQPVLIQTSYFDGEPGSNASRDACNPVVAVCPDHFKWSRGPKALCGILIEARIRSLIDQPVALVPQTTLSTIFNLLKKRDVIDATQWPNAIFGHDGLGRPQISALFENKGTDQLPRPRLNQRLLPAGNVAIILDGRDISDQIDALQALLSDITPNLRPAPAESDQPLGSESSVGASPETADQDLAGIWLSEYEYPSQDPKPGIYKSQTYVVFNQAGSVVIAESLTNSQGSGLKLSLGVHRYNIIIGTWEERTSKKALYHGSINLILEPAGMLLRGKWLGFDRRYNINTGPWNFTLQDRDVSAKVKRKYEMLHAGHNHTAARMLPA